MKPTTDCIKSIYHAPSLSVLKMVPSMAATSEPYYPSLHSRHSDIKSHLLESLHRIHISLINKQDLLRLKTPRFDASILQARGLLLSQNGHPVMCTNSFSPVRGLDMEHSLARIS